MQRAFLWLLGGLAGLVAFFRLYPSAFPEASIDFRIRHTEAIEIGAKALKELGAPDFSAHISSVDFGVDEKAKRFLEKTMGLEAADEVMRKEVAVWYYHCRWVKPGDRHIYEAFVSPDGRLFGVEISLPEEAPGASLSEKEARQIAERFLVGQLKVPLHEWRFVEAQQFQQPDRRDFLFVYEHRQKQFPPNRPEAGKVRLWVQVAGDKVVGYYLPYLHTPESWRFRERQQQSARVVLMVASIVLYMVLLIALIVKAVRLFAFHRETPLWRLGGILGGIKATLLLITGLNFLPLQLFEYDPAQPMGVFFTLQFGLLVISALVVGLGGAFVGLVGERLSREQPPAGIPLSAVFHPAFLTTREAVISILTGIGLGCIHLAYVVAFYLLGRQVGVWTPLGISYTESVLTPLPFVVPLFMGLSPALSEELLFRVAFLYLLWSWFKRWWVAALVSGAVWASLHVGYPPEPIYIRWLELTVVGLVYAWVMIRYGLLASIAAHYTYNAVLEATLLVQAEEPFLRWSGIAAGVGMVWLLLPAAIALIKYRRLRSVDEVPPLEAQPLPTPTFEPVPYAPYQPIARYHWWILGALTAAGIVATVLTKEDFQPITLLQVNRSEAKQIAINYLRRKGVPTERYWVAVDLVEALDEDQPETAYLLEHADRSTLIRFWQEEKPPIYWVVRFFRPLEREEWLVYVALDGRVLSFIRRLPEEAKGAQLSREAALKLAEAYLREEVGVRLDEWRLVESDVFNRPQRRDWVFYYEHKHRKVGEAPLRMRVSVLGDLAQGYRLGWQVPEAWHFQREQFEAWTDLAGLYFLVLGLVLLAVAVIGSIREGIFRINWRLGLKLAVPLMLLSSLSVLNQWESLFWFRYPNPLPVFVWAFILVGVSTIVVAFLLLFSAALLGSLEPEWLPKRLPELVPVSLWLRRQRCNDPSLVNTPVCHPAALRDALALGYLVSLGAIGIFQGAEMQGQLIRASWLPALDYLNLVAWSVVLGLWLGIVFAGIYRYHVRTLERLVILLLLFLPVGLLGAASPEEALKGVGTLALTLFGGAVGLYWLGRFVVRHNLYAWALMIALPLLLSISVQLLRAPDLFWKLQAVPLLVVYALPALWWLWSVRRSQFASTPSQTQPQPFAVDDPSPQSDAPH